MAEIPDSAQAELTCPKCGHKFVESVGRLRSSPWLRCAGCGAQLQIRAHLNDDKNKISIDKSFEDFRSFLKKLGVPPRDH